jgi:hypothetical protein
VLKAWRTGFLARRHERIQRELSEQQLREQRRSNRISQIGIAVAIVVAGASLAVSLREDTTPTRVVTVRPFDITGSALQVAHVTTGTCRDSVLSNRPDAVRCFYDTGGEQVVVEDPCFRNPGMISREVVCILDLEAMTLVRVNVPSIPPLGPTIGTDDFVPFRLVLGSGDMCLLFSGAGPIAVGVDREDFYVCAVGHDEYFVHDINPDNPIWTVHVIDEESSAGTLTKVAEAFR